MKKRYFYLPGFVLLFFSQLLFAQGLVSVNNYTGTANVVLPLYNVTKGSLSAPISLIYDGSGVKVKDVEGLGGMGWNLSAGGGVYRTVRGLPDDIKKDNANYARLGWLNNDKAGKITGFTIINTAGPDSTKETHDAAYINTNFNDLSDTEPDIYNVSAPGLSCQLVFDASHQIRIMPYRDYKVSFTRDSDSLITSFTIKNDLGTSYLFDVIETASRKLVAGPSGVSYFTKEYNQYQNGISYTTAWRLSSMMDLHGNDLSFHYIDNEVYDRNTPLKLAIGALGASTTLFTVKERFNKKLIDFIGTEYDLVEIFANFSYKDYKRTGKVLSGVTAYGTGASLSYLPVIYHGSTDYTRWFLNGLYSSNKTYKFSYKGLYKIAGDTYINLPDSASKKVDLWGYYKGGSATSLIPQLYVNPTDTTLERYRNLSPGTHSSAYPYGMTGADRSVNADSVNIGALDTVFYSKAAYTNLTTNGYSVIKYEPNDYYDPTAGAVIPGGGLRTKQVKDFNGSGNNPIDTQNYAYLTPGTSISSGKPLSVPVYAFTELIQLVTAPDDPWDLYNVRSEDDLSPNGAAIVYSAVKISRPGAGSTVYEYSTPAVFYESSHPADWQPTTTYVARSSGFAKNFYGSTGKYTYPFPNNANYNFQRGLLTNVSSYNSGGDKVSESTYTYVRTASTPTVVTGFKLEIFGNVYSYAKYNINTVIDNQTAQVSTKVFDLGSTTVYKTSIVDYYYTSSYHKLLTQQKNTNSDGTINRTNIKYIKDYAASSNADSTNTAIYHLQQLNVNYPVETYAQVERGGTNKTIGASLVKYKTFDFGGFGIYKPAQKLNFVSGTGLTDFSPSAVTSGVFTYDSRYIPYENDLIYDYLGNLQTVNDNNRNVSTSFVDITKGLPLANITNASANQVSFNSVANYVDRNPYAQYYIFSIRIKADTAGTDTVTLTDGGHTHKYTMPYTTSTDYKYYSRRIPLTDMTGNFSFAYHNSNTVDATEALFYPDVAQVSTYSYNEAHLKTSETNTNGKSVFYDYDPSNRLSHVYDNEHNIVMRKSYVIQNDTTGNDMGNGTITATPRTAPTVTLNAGFAKMTNLTGAVYTWNFGDGSSSVTSTDILGEIVHTFPRVDVFTVSVTVTSPYYNTKTVSQSISSGVPPANIDFTTANLDNGTGTVTSVQFMRPDGSVVRYAWGQTILETNDIKLDHGVYKVIIGVKGQPYDAVTGLGFSSVTLNIGGTAVACGQYHAKEASYIFECDLTDPAINLVAVTVSTNPCNLPGQ